MDQIKVARQAGYFPFLPLPSNQDVLVFALGSRKIPGEALPSSCQWEASPGFAQAKHSFRLRLSAPVCG